MFDDWTIAVFHTMSGYWPVVFKGYKVWYVGAVMDKPIADNDNVPRPKRI